MSRPDRNCHAKKQKPADDVCDNVLLTARKLLIPKTRRDVRVVEGARLESVCRGNSTEGSNPSLSAIRLRSLLNGGELWRDVAPERLRRNGGQPSPSDRFARGYGWQAVSDSVIEGCPQ
jgi:hypothetical protein